MNELRAHRARLAAAVVALALGGAAIAGCGSDDVDQAADDIREEAQEAGDDIRDEAEQLGDDAQEAGQDIADEAEQAGEDIRDEAEELENDISGDDDSGSESNGSGG
jgi:hypothetical protein